MVIAIIIANITIIAIIGNNIARTPAGHPTTCSVQNVFARFAPAATTTTKQSDPPVSGVDEAANVDFSVTIAGIL